MELFNDKIRVQPVDLTKDASGILVSTQASFSQNVVDVIETGDGELNGKYHVGDRLLVQGVISSYEVSPNEVVSIVDAKYVIARLSKGEK